MQLATSPTATSTIRSTETRQQCWMEWLLNNLYEGQEGRGYFHTGTGLHSAFERIIKGVPYDVAEEMMMQWISDEIWSDENTGVGTLWTKARPEETWKEDVARLLKSWYDEVHPDGGSTIPFEYEWPPRTEVWLDVETPDFHLKTQVDAVFIADEVVTIVDWKTGANKGSDDRQLHVYWWAARQMEIVPPFEHDMNAYFYYVHHREWVAPRMPYPGDEAIYDMIARAEEQRRRGYYHVEPSWKCKYCQVSEVCPAWGDNESLSWPELMELATTLDWSGVNE